MQALGHYIGDESKHPSKKGYLLMGRSNSLTLPRKHGPGVLCFIANGITDADKKGAVLLTISGPAATYKLIRKKPAEKSFAELVAPVKTHYS